MPEYLTNEQVRDLAIERHWGQRDKLGKPYYFHLQAVAGALSTNWRDLEQAGWLHDVLEDTDTTATELEQLGVNPETIRVVQAVTKHKGGNFDYATYLREIPRSGGQAAVLVKIADNAHNSLEERAAQLDPANRERLAKRYADAREVLWYSAYPSDIAEVLGRINLPLLKEFEALPTNEFGTPIREERA